MAEFDTRIVSTQQLSRLSGAINSEFGFLSAQGAVTTSANLTVNVAAIAANSYLIGRAIQANAYSASTVTCGAAHATLSRIDTVTINTSGTVAIVAGTAATDPVPPTLSSIQLEICQILVGPAVTSLSAGNLTDRRQIVNLGPQAKYKAAGQNFEDTSLTTVTAASGNMEVSLGVGLHLVRVTTYVSAVGTAASGGLKLALSWTGTMTNLNMVGRYPLATLRTDPTDGNRDDFSDGLIAGTATSGTAFMSSVAFNTTVATGLRVGLVEAEFIFSVTVAGIVTLKGGQDTDAGTTTLVNSHITATPLSSV